MLAAAWHITQRAGNPWDFQTFYYAATAAARGLDPYRLDALSAAAGREVTLPFLYPPATLALFVPFTLLPIKTAAWVWLGIKLGLVAVLVAVWRRVFLREVSILALIAAGFFGFNAAILLDLTTGNVSVLEQLLLWLAFSHYVQDRRWPFALLVVIASVFKLFPIFFLGLVLVPSQRHRPSPRLALTGLALFGAIALLPSALGVGWARDFLSNLPGQPPYGEGSPSALGIFQMWLDSGRPSAGGAGSLPLVLWGIYGASLMVLSRQLFRRAWTMRDPLQWVVIGTLLFALLSPRMMLYSYVLLIAPALLLVHRLIPRGRLQVVALVLLVVQGAARCLLPRVYLPAVANLPFFAGLIVVNMPFLLALGLWLGFMRAGGRILSR